MSYSFTDYQLNRYNRHIILKGFGPKAQKKLLESSVLVIGAGGLGAPALLYLAAAGIGIIGIADYDIVDISNLQRQIIYEENDIGTLKTESALRCLHKFNKGIQYKLHSDEITSSNILELIHDYDFVIDGTDTTRMKLLINDACVIANKPFCHAGAVEFGGQLMTVVPRKSTCLRCIFDDNLDDKLLTCAHAGIIGAVVGVLGSLLALEAIKYLTNTGTVNSDSMLSFQGDTMHFHSIRIERNPQCIVCGANPVITALNERKYDSCNQIRREQMDLL